jgi:catechol 2,3-dioxygenase-like lactoylglutathione lyase family enzyme
MCSERGLREVHIVPVFKGISHIELTVRDADRSAGWYERVLGMQRVAEHSEHPMPGVSARVINMLHPTARLALGLITHESTDDAELSEFRVGLDHLALNVESRDELERWLEHLDGCGVSHSAINDLPHTGSAVAFRDPDNIQLELWVLASDFRLG